MQRWVVNPIRIWVHRIITYFLWWGQMVASLLYCTTFKFLDYSNVAIKLKFLHSGINCLGFLSLFFALQGERDSNTVANPWLEVGERSQRGFWPWPPNIHYPCYQLIKLRLNYSVCRCLHFVAPRTIIILSMDSSFWI